MSSLPLLSLPQDLRPPRSLLGHFHRIGRWLLLAGHGFQPHAGSPPLPQSLSAFVNVLEEHRRAYAQAARLYSARYQDGYWLMYLAVALAVVCAAGGATWGSERVFAGIETFLMAGTIALYWRMRSGRWREKWLRARRTAECLRYLPLIAPFVTDRSRNWYETLADRNAQDPEVTRFCAWVAQQKIAADISLLDPQVYREYRDYLAGTLEAQIAYHEARARQETALTHRLGAASNLFFIVAAVCTALIFLRPYLGGLASFTPSAATLRFLATVLPAVGACARGLLAQSESHRMATLSASVQAALTSHLQKLRALPSPQAQDGAPAVERLTWAAVRELLSEADAWKSLHDTAELSLGN